MTSKSGPLRGFRNESCHFFIFYFSTSNLAVIIRDVINDEVQVASRINKAILTGRYLLFEQEFQEVDGRLGSTGHVVITNLGSANAFASDQAKKLGAELVH